MSLLVFPLGPRSQEWQRGGEVALGVGVLRPVLCAKFETSDADAMN